MNCREFKEQFTDGLNLDQAAEKHVEKCGGCKIFHKENFQLTQMFRSLPKVEAPQDFEFGFRSKLAQSQLKKPVSPIWQILRFVLPSAAFVLIFGFVIFNSNLFEAGNTEQIARTESPAAIVENDGAANSFVAENIGQNNAETNDPQESNEIAGFGEETTETAISEPQVPVKETQKPAAEKLPVQEIATTQKPAVTKKPDDEEIISQDTVEESEIQSVDSALSQSRIKNPINVEPERNIEPGNIETTKKTLSSRESLSRVGISTSNANGGLLVTSVRPGSSAQNAGVQLKDIILEINGRKVSNQRLEENSLRTLTILRDGKQIRIAVSN